MSYNKKEWVNYGRKKANSVDIIIRDKDDKTIESFKVYNKGGEIKKNTGNFPPRKVLKILKDKYDFDFNFENNKRFLDKDINW